MSETAYYCISPNADLVSLIERHDAEWGCLLQKPVLISREEGGPGDILRSNWKQLHLAQVKTVFMSSIVNDYVIEHADCGAFLRDFVMLITGYPAISEAEFDKWWIINRIDGLYERFEELEREFFEGGLDEFVTPAVDGMVEWLRGTH